MEDFIEKSNSEFAAFPSELKIDGKTVAIYPGLNKREYFAGLAMQGFCANENKLNNTPKFIAELSIKLADEILKQLEETKNP